MEEHLPSINLLFRIDQNLWFQCFNKDIVVKADGPVYTACVE